MCRIRERGWKSSGLMSFPFYSGRGSSTRISRSISSLFNYKRRHIKIRALWSTSTSSYINRWTILQEPDINITQPAAAAANNAMKRKKKDVIIDDQHTFHCVPFRQSLWFSVLLLYRSVLMPLCIDKRKCYTYTQHRVTENYTSVTLRCFAAVQSSLPFCIRKRRRVPPECFTAK